MTETKTPNKLVQELFNLIDNDLYAWICVWGPPRTGKSNLCLLLSYYVYKDWDEVLNSVVFNLNGLLYKLQNGEPKRFPTRNGLHMRVPLLFMDDYGAHCNKAKTQHERGWDIFKGGFDTLGTMIGVLLANMVSPNEATQQLSEKYTHEIFVYSRGNAKYDVVHQEQDFRSWSSRQKKEWLLDFEFPMVPDDVFKQYDEMRMQLAEEVLFSINETIAVEQVEQIIKRIQSIDINLLKVLLERGPSSYEVLQKEMGQDYRNAVMRMKARGIIIPKRIDNHYYKYDITDLGLDVVKALQEENRLPSPKQPHLNIEE
jgi:hypothetical protein